MAITESILELENRGISNFRERDGQIEVGHKSFGLEVQRDVVCLAKANMPIHCIETYNSFSDQAKLTFAKGIIKNT